MIAYLTCELKGRDLDSRLLIAAELLKRGVTVMIGQQWAIFANSHKMPKGCVLIKSCTIQMARAAAQCKSHGHAIAIVDEEALPFRMARSYIDNMVPEICAPVDVFFAQNEKQKTIIEQTWPEMVGKIILSGNCRIDVLANPKAFVPMANQIRHEHGTFLLFNANFGSLNSVWGSPPDVLFVEQLIEWERANSAEFTAFIDWCSRYTDYNIVVRPHPAERAETYDAIKHKPRVKIISGTDPVPWLIAAECVIHTNCTTGLEASFLGKRIINIEPDPDNFFSRQFIMDEINPTVRTWEEAAQLLQTGVPVKSPGPGLFHNIGHAAETIAAEMTKILKAMPPLSLPMKWDDVPLEKVSKAAPQKMTVSPEEFIRSCDMMLGAAGLNGVKATHAGDSVFLLTPP